MGMTTENQGVRRYQRLDGNIGYLETAALIAEPGAAAPFVTAALSLLADTDALILDLRGEGGDGALSPSGVSTWSCGEVPPGGEAVRLDRPVYLLTGPAAAVDGETAALVPDLAVPAEEALAVAYQHALRKLPPRPVPAAATL